MRQFVIKDYHRDFQEHCVEQVNILSSKIHDCNSTIYSAYYYFQDNFHLLHKYRCEINIQTLLDNKTNKHKHLRYSSDDVEEKYFIHTYNNFISTIDVIVKLTRLIKYYTFLAKIPYLVYRVIIYAINYEISVQLLKGYPFNYPKLGKVWIGRVPYKSSIPDWGQSMKFKQFLLDNGVAVKDKDNVDGKAWLVDNGLDRDDFVLLRWSKSKAQLRNKEVYRLYPTVRCNLYDKKMQRTIPISELLEMTKTGLFDKIIHLYRHHHEYCVNNYPFHINQ